MFSPHGPSLRELAVQALSSVERGYDLLAPKFDHTPFRTPPGILDGAVEVLSGLGRGGSGAVFTSGGAITTICARLLGLSPAGCVALHRVVVNGGITKIVSGRGGIALISFNEHAHLEAPLVTYR